MGIPGQHRPVDRGCNPAFGQLVLDLQYPVAGGGNLAFEARNGVAEARLLRLYLPLKNFYGR